ncbi:MAG TPA: hypothetical protein VFZ25_08810, partial [Chloroflexota bacterium]|nr:hypothetical protein [Chloroflexota bacterium]
LRPQEDEVAAVLRVPIRALQRPTTLGSVPHPRRPGVEVPAYRWHGEVIWGATFQSVAELLRRLIAAGIW